MANKAQKECSELKKRAMLAKQRLKSGYWQELERERKSVYDENGLSIDSMIFMKERVRLDEGRMLGSASVSREEQFYQKVCKILDKDEDTMNPIGQLMDREEYERLDEGNRARYVLELSGKFREMRDRYYRERVGKSC